MIEWNLSVRSVRHLLLLRRWTYSITGTARSATQVRERNAKMLFRTEHEAREAGENMLYRLRTQSRRR